MNNIILKRKTLLAMLLNVARDEPLYAINGLKFEFDKDGVHVIGTDGRRMVILENNEIRFDKSYSAIIHCRDLKAALSGFSANKNYIRLSFRSYTVAIECGRMEHRMNNEYKWVRSKEYDQQVILKLRVGGTYPKWRDVVPKEENLRNASPICVNAKYLYEMSQVLASLDTPPDDNRNAIKVLQHNGKEDECVVIKGLEKHESRYDGWKYTGVIMPIRQ